MLNNKIKNFIKNIQDFIFYKNTESYKNAVVIIIMAAVLLISYNIATFIMAYHNINIESKQKAKIISSLGEFALQDPLWNLDDDVIAKIANSLFFDREVDSVKITSITGTVMFEKNKNNLEAKDNHHLVYSTQSIVKNGMIETGYVITSQKLGTIKIGITKYYKQLHIIKTFISNVILNLITLLLIYLAIIAILNQEKYNKQKIKAILDNMVDSVITTDQNLNIKSCNLATEKMFDFTTSEIIGLKFNKLLLSDNSDEINADNLNIYSTNVNLNFNGLKKNGEAFPVEFNVGSIILGNEQLFIIVIRDITIRKEVEKIKNEFISTVSHELRTPLTSIKGSLSLLKEEIFGKMPVETMKLINIADNNSTRLVSLINDILDIERMESGKMELSLEVHNIILIIKEAVECNLPYASQFGVGLQFVNNIETINVLVDKQKIIQVLANLISNAIKFSQTNGVVEVSVEQNGHTVRVSVKDEGIGIPLEYKNKLFQKFVQVDASDTRKKGGTGLGLSICKAIIKKHKGLIDFDSKQNEGSVFYFELQIYETTK